MQILRLRGLRRPTPARCQSAIPEKTTFFHKYLILNFLCIVFKKIHKKTIHNTIRGA
jgi:hypothetical protein